MSNRDVGSTGELVALRAVRRSGAKILARRLVTKQCEVDLVSRERDTLVLHEVKTGFRSVKFRAGDHLENDQAQRLVQAAETLGLKTGATHIRLELIEVHLDRSGTFQIERSPLACP